jgi:hypothetical protein
MTKTVLFNNTDNMAIVHGKAASTEYLLYLLPEIDGRRFESSKDIQQFYDNYTEILKEAKTVYRNKIERDIAKLEVEEKSLNCHYNESIALKRRELNERINEFNKELQTSRSFFSKIKLRVKVLIETTFIEEKIANSCKHIKNELSQNQIKKSELIKNKESIVNQKCGNITTAYHVIYANKTFLIGASGEEEVIEHLKFLPDDYHVFNDVKIDFAKWIYWKKGKDGDKNIKTSQIDHLVVGPTGLFLIETKKWRRTDIENKRSDVVYQIQRANYALWRYLINSHIDCDIRIRSVAVSIHGNSQWQKIDDHIFLMPPYSLPKYITYGKSIYTPEIVDRIVLIIPR